MPPEDGRTAATLKTTLSCSVIASAFAAIAVEAAIAVFVMDKRQNLPRFMTIAILAAVALILSSISGSLGIAKVYKPGYSGTWNSDAGKGFFSAQALLGGLGLLLVVISAFCGDPKPDVPKEPSDYQTLKGNVVQLQKDVASLQASKQHAAPPPKKSPQSQTRKKSARGDNKKTR
jgi:Ni/Fe-hydrogenase subunit HybB-like protein